MLIIKAYSFEKLIWTLREKTECAHANNAPLPRDDNGLIKQAKTDIPYQHLSYVLSRAPKNPLACMLRKFG